MIKYLFTFCVGIFFAIMLMPVGYVIIRKKIKKRKNNNFWHKIIDEGMRIEPSFNLPIEDLGEVYLHFCDNEWDERYAPKPKDWDNLPSTSRELNWYNLFLYDMGIIITKRDCTEFLSHIIADEIVYRVFGYYNHKQLSTDDIVKICSSSIG
mgnify:FL=1